MSDLIRLTGLWKSQTKAGDIVLSGSISPTSKLIILPNNYKQKDSEPDYIAFMAPYEKQEKKQPDKPQKPEIPGL
jgi:hypothetical protein